MAANSSRHKKGQQSKALATHSKALGTQSKAKKQCWAKWPLSTFDLYPWGEGHGVQGQICEILRPPASYESLPAPLSTQIPTLCIVYIHLGGGGVGGSDIRSMSSIRPICKCRCPPLHKRLTVKGTNKWSHGKAQKAKTLSEGWHFQDT